MKNVHSKAIQRLQQSKRKTPRKITHLGTNTTSKGSAQVTPKEMGTRSSLEGCMSRKLKCRKKIHLSLPQGNTGPGHKYSVDLHTPRLSELSSSSVRQTPNPTATWVLGEGVMGAELSARGAHPSSGSALERLEQRTWAGSTCNPCCTQGNAAIISSESVESWSG